MGAGFDVAINYGYTERAMDVSIAEAKNRLPELIRAVEQMSESRKRSECSILLCGVASVKWGRKALKTYGD